MTNLEECELSKEGTHGLSPGPGGRGAGLLTDCLRGRGAEETKQCGNDQLSDKYVPRTGFQWYGS